MRTQDPVPTTLERVRVVADRYRQFRVTPAEAARRYGIDTILLHRLLDLGLPHRRDAHGLVFDGLDLENVGLGLRLPSPQRTVMSRWQRSLTGRSTRERGRYELRISWKCPTPGHEGPCDFALDPLLAGAGPATFRGSTLSLVVEPLCEPHDFGHDLDEVVAEAQRIDFHRIPDELVTDLGFLAGTGLADCRLATLHFIRMATAAGLTVRPASGYFIGAPFPTQHTWFEVALGDRWVPADPFFLHTLAEWGIIDRREWPPAHSPCNVLWRLASTFWTDAPLVGHGRVPAPLNVVARWQPAVEGSA